MNIFKSDWFWIIVIVVVIVGGCFWVADRTVENAKVRGNIRRNHIYEHGVKAGHLGVPAQANPYRY